MNQVKAISNISFLVIARNEEFAIEKCLRSIVEMPLENCEIICVDSGSTDGTLSVMRKYADENRMVKIYKCEGYSNAAIARNIGIKQATKEYIYFVDGDIELYEEFVKKVLDLLNSGSADAVTGQLRDVYYNTDYSMTLKTVNDRFNIEKEESISNCGGCFIARRAIVNELGDWDEQLVVNEDIEYTMRLTRKHRLLAIPHAMGTHHTRGYPQRIGQFILKLYPMYFGMIIRRNLDRPKAVLQLINRNKGFFGGFIFYLLLTVLIILSALGLIKPIAVLLIATSFIAIDFLQGTLKGQNTVERLLSHYIYAPLITLGLFLNLKNNNPKTRSIKIICPQIGSQAISDVSFLVIARNEEFAIEKCLRSIVEMPLENCEIICVDSGSTDGTLSVMRKYADENQMVEIYKCEGYSNAAIARNIGIKQATKEYIYFVDGDIELYEEFVKKVLDLLNSGSADAVTGQLREVYYNNDYSMIINTVQDRFNINKEELISNCGGCFFTRRAIVNELGDWDEQLVRNQDIDYTLRFTRKHRLLAIPHAMGTHHTRCYPQRIGQFILKLYPMYFGMIIRRNLDRPKVVLNLLGRNKGILWGLTYYLFFIFLIVLSILGYLQVYVIFIIMISVLMVDIVYGLLKADRLLERLCNHYIYAPLTAIGLIYVLDLRRKDSQVSRIV